MPEPATIHRRVREPMVTLGLVAVLLLGLQIPITMIRSVIGDRQATRDQAVAEVTENWGRAQTIIGPRVVVPFGYRPDGATEDAVGLASFLPDELAIDAAVASQPLTRGLFTIPAYRGTVRIEGRFSSAADQALGVPREALDWERASLVVELTDTRGLGSESTLTWREESVPLLPGALSQDPLRTGVHSPVSWQPGEGAEFSIVLSLRGASELRFTPFARNTRVSLTSDWADPSFVGAWLPESREVDDAGFLASWEIPFLGRDYAQQWLSVDEPLESVRSSAFGVAFLSEVDGYRMAERSTKYAALFLTFTFALIWLFDVTTGVRVHPIQYLLVGSAMCLFYLLELSLSEHLGFGAAYGIAASSVVALVAGYAGAVLRSHARGAVLGGVIGLTYAYLLALLTLEQYALLAGSVGLLVMLAIVMHQTRWIDWYSLGEDPAAI